MADLKAAALIEDYFFVNEDLIAFFASPNERDLVAPFCIKEDGYLIFNLAINYGSTSGPMPGVPNITTKLYVNNNVVASSFVFDSQEPNNVAIFWEGVVMGDD